MLISHRLINLGSLKYIIVVHTYLYAYFELANGMRYSSLVQSVEVVFTSLLSYYIGGG